MSIEIELRFEVLDNPKLDVFIKKLQIESKRRVLGLYFYAFCMQGSFVLEEDKHLRHPGVLL